MQLLICWLVKEDLVINLLLILSLGPLLQRLTGRGVWVSDKIGKLTKNIMIRSMEKQRVARGCNDSSRLLDIL